MKGPVVRLALPADLVAMQNIEKHCYRQSDTYCHLPKVVARQERYGGLVAVIGGRIVGHAVLRHYDKHLTVLSVGVLSDSRLKNCGKSLLAGVIELAKEDCSEVRIAINEREDANLKWVRNCRLGFKAVLDGVTVLFTYGAPQPLAVCGPS